MTTVDLSNYELQVLLGTSISGSNMHPETTFDLPAAWTRLHTLGLIDRTDGLAIITTKGEAYLTALRAIQSTKTGDAA